ncbi:hypothetical protein LUZ61_019644 [Rhynchospora tenuis]|uniref:Reverse transcriptase domain-containing protein n=1 Tax=Rhynchospora tenuis TaxID=198213 RepID=A0AAD6EN03_9POAL|nr:hypothetical protein LUZ61_019644 [Rhynchospora tenuis]
MGSDSETLPVSDWSMLYPLSFAFTDSLTSHVSNAEIAEVIKDWPPNKSPGPDGFTGEFFKFFLPEICDELRLSINRGLQVLSLHPLNNSFIALIPKKENPLSSADYRPISVVHSVQKITSKILANRLKQHISSLISDSQSGFVQGRLITENFLYAQQVVHKARKVNLPLALFKADIHKAFDTLSWSFLHSLFLALGKSISLKKRVRQEDPLSPYLFILAMDFLARWLSKLVEVGAFFPPFTSLKRCLLYADDALFFLQPSLQQCQLLQIILHGFQALSGLTVNPHKFDLLFTFADSHLLSLLSSELGCDSANFPITYLGLPLSDKKLGKSAYGPLIGKFASRLAGWSGALLSFAGRSGELALFWHHDWGLGILKHTFPQLFSFAVDDLLTVSTFLRLAWTSQHELFMPSMFSSALSSTQLHQLLLLLSNNPNLFLNLGSHIPDTLLWKMQLPHFTSASFYKLFKTNPAPLSDLRLFWKLKAPPKMIVFAWQMLQQRIRTQDVLQKRGWHLANRCPLCTIALETPVHISQDCSSFVSVCQRVY